MCDSEAKIFAFTEAAAAEIVRSRDVCQCTAKKDRALRFSCADERAIRQNVSNERKSRCGGGGHVAYKCGPDISVEKGKCC